MKKKTEELMNEIIASKDISRYIGDNTEEFIDTPLHVYLKELLSDARLTVSQVAELSCKGEYIYHVVLSIALAMGLNPDEASRLLRIARMPLLDARNRRDSIIIFALNRKLTVPDTNDILYEFDVPCL